MSEKYQDDFYPKRKENVKIILKGSIINWKDRMNHWNF